MFVFSSLLSRTRLLLLVAITLGACGDDPVVQGPGTSDASSDLREREDANQRPDLGNEMADGGDVGTETDSAEDIAGDAATDDTSVLTDVDGDDAPVDTNTVLDVSSDGSSTLRNAGPGDVVIVEIQGNPVYSDDAEAEYLELLNVSTDVIRLRNMRLAYAEWMDTEPDASDAIATVLDDIVLQPGERAVLARSDLPGGFRPEGTYDGFVITNDEDELARLRIYTAAWDGSEPPQPEDIVDAVRFPGTTFDNPLRGRTWQLNPEDLPSPTTEGNDNLGNWCHTSEITRLEYRASNWGTPQAPNDCSFFE